MKFGNICFSYQPPGESHKEVMDRFVRLGVASEELNFDTYWTLEHHFTEFGLTGNLFVACANLLGRTTKLNVGTMGIVLPTAHPARQMEDLLLLDQMSKGRFNFGVVRGLYHKDFRVFGVTMEDSRAITEDFHTMIMDGTKTGTLHTDGKNIEFPDVNVYPEAYLEKIPTCMTAESAVTTTWLAERGLPMVLSWIITTSEKKAQMELYNAVARDSGYSEEYIKNVDHSMTLICSVDEDGKKAEDVCREFLGNWYDSYVNATNIFSESNQTRGYDYHKGQWKDFVLQGHTNTKRRVDYSHDLNPVGTPEKCIEIIQRDIDATGITNITLGFEANGSEEEIIASMKRFMTQVAPFLKDPK
ncbi:LLM class flavin-dependent oxidoreductase [Photobacterium kishitanii]|uniref:Alkanal monooxygenase n=7 Tax=Photobacterium TaxID=657 RepID=A7UQV2_9GAMM|nr:alkanal monooxygenase [Photobacterium kishitanii]UUZ29865.1 LuxA [Photobacterium phosphoreum]AAX51408.2 luciferase alpha subunit [Photobacterium kishitanii]ABR21780.1 luciferase alpha subunit [Photobacterium kishitanii]PSU95572.1 LLM class flavin-dependent oxidoreductase [Photobacterium kishitanii]PSV14258.1 LLM class flavin-dependent oxidoreductase [Photobacterium kishitanii]